ncbi:MAG: EamA family transporter [Candidatus Aminicenantes bacterium]|nr:MAG: EamA family transporter [Candidatus Aminicenantes bacterium]
MVWIAYSFLTALFEALKDVLGKKSLEKCNEYIVAWAMRIFALPFLLPLLLFTKTRVTGNLFWLALVAGGTLNLITTILYMKAIKASDLSVTVPMVTFTPLFLLLTSPIIVREFPPLLGIFGILLIVLGSYLLHLKEKQKRLLAPFKALVTEKGPRLMLVVAFIWSITSNIDKVGIQSSSVVLWAIAIHIFSIVSMAPVVWFASRTSIHQLWKHQKILFPLGLINALKYFFQLAALQFTLVAYVISIKRTSAILCVIFGALIFKEKGLKERLTGSVIMVLGVLLITL